MTKNNILSPFDIVKPLKIRVVKDYESAIHWLEKGYVPVECSFGNRSVVDDLILDHHGCYSNQAGVAVRAYRDLFGIKRDSPHFVVTGYPDEDATFAICALAGILPHPSYADSFPDASEETQILVQIDLTAVAMLINAVDLNPNLALELLDTFIGRLILAWRQQGHRNCRDQLAWYGAVDRWRTVLTSQNREFIDAALESQVSDLSRVIEANHYIVSPRVAVIDFSEFGPNSSYYRVWLKHYPVIIAYIGGAAGYGTCSFAVRDLATAQSLFGPGGLMEVYANLYPGRCGGREILGGSSRTNYITWENACSYGEQLEALILQNAFF